MRWNSPARDAQFIWLSDGQAPAPHWASSARPDSSALGYDATLAMARRAMRRGDWAGAEALLMRAAPLTGNDPAFFNLAGVLWEVRGDRRAARKFYGLAIRSDRRYEPAQQNMRRLYELSTFGHTRQPVALGDEPAAH